MQKLISLVLILLLCPLSAFAEGTDSEEILLSSFEDNGTLYVETEQEADEHDGLLELLPVEAAPEESAPAAAQDTAFTPSLGSPFAFTGDEGYWSLPMDITDEDAVWKVLTSDMTVISLGKKSDEKTQVYLRAAPDDKSEKVGAVTCETQGVRVIEQLENGWSLVECYSSSFHGTAVQAWNMLVQGYVKTSSLKTITPYQDLGIVIDKLTQRLYIFQQGKLYDTLLVSTGLANKDQPYNETRSGEFVTASKVGEFPSGNLRCSMGIRINSGDLIHEVPHMVNKDGSFNYSTTEGKLGTRASHGCIRVQRLKTAKGTNMTWLWNNIKNNGKVRVLIWEDWQGRQIDPPADDTVIYYNPKKGQYYHAEETCSSAKKVTFVPALYSDLQGDLSYLKRCASCSPPLTLEQVNAINEAHAPGGDHDPVLTKRRQKYITFRSKLNNYLSGYYQE